MIYRDVAEARERETAKAADSSVARIKVVRLELGEAGTTAPVNLPFQDRELSRRLIYLACLARNQAMRRSRMTL